jgi:hypothetical protein
MWSPERLPTTRHVISFAYTNGPPKLSKRLSSLCSERNTELPAHFEGNKFMPVLFRFRRSLCHFSFNLCTSYFSVTDFRSQRRETCKVRNRVFWTWRCVVCWVVSDVSEDHAAFIFMVKQPKNPVVAGTTVYRSVGNESPSNTASHSSRLDSLATSL